MQHNVLTEPCWTVGGCQGHVCPGMLPRSSQPSFCGPSKRRDHCKKRRRHCDGGTNNTDRNYPTSRTAVAVLWCSGVVHLVHWCRMTSEGVGSVFKVPSPFGALGFAMPCINVSFLFVIRLFLCIHVVTKLFSCKHVFLITPIM